MKLDEMAKLLNSDKEHTLVGMYVNKLNQLRGFQEVCVPKGLIEKIERECDVRGIPCYKVTDNMLSTHDSYFELYDAEQYR